MCSSSCQGLYQVRQSSEECRFFHGRERRSLTDPSPASLEYRIPPPSTLLDPPKSTMKSSGLAVALYGAGGGAGVVAPHKRPADGGLEGPPPLPKELYRGRRRRRPRRRRSPTLIPPAAFAGDGGKGEEVEAEGGRIDLLSCQEVVRGELERLDGELDRQAETLARRYRRWVLLLGGRWLGLVVTISRSRISSVGFTVCLDMDTWCGAKKIPV